MKNLRHALRTLAKTPFLTGVAVVSLALGIGANAAIYSLFDQMLVRPLPVPEPHRLVNFEVPGPNPGSQSCGAVGGCDEVLSYPMLRDLERYESRTLAGVAGHVPFGVNLAFDGRVTNGQGLQVTGSYFPVLGLKPALGRLLTPADDQTIGEHPVAVLSYGYWKRELGGDPGVLNRRIVANGEPLTVIGVAPEGFRSTTLGLGADIFVPMTMRGVMHRWFDGWENRRWYWAYAFARLAPGVTIEEAEAEMSPVYNRIINEVEAELQSQMTDERMEEFRAKRLVLVEGTRGQSSMRGEYETPLRLLFVITSIVLVIACANVANLLLARGAGRSGEMAIRGAMGASRRQLFGQLLLESLLLAVLGGAASLLVAHWTLKLLPAVLPPESLGTLVVRLEPAVVFFTGAVALGTGFLFGMFPALHGTRVDLATVLRAGTLKGSEARSGSRFRNALVTAQIALSMLLLIGAGVFLRSLGNVARVDLGLETDDVISFQIAPALNGYDPERTKALFVEAEDRLAAIPGVTAVTGALVAVLGGNSWGNDVSVEGYDWVPGMPANARYNEVGPGYFSALGIPLLAGREFTASDVSGAPKVAVVNEAWAEQFGLDPRETVGTYMAMGSGQDELDIEIVGVVRDARYADVKDDVPAVTHLPYRQNDGLTNLTFYMRTGIDPASVMRQIPAVIAEFDGDLPVQDLKTMEQQVRENIVIDRLISTLSAAFAVLATLLAAIGLYGVLSFAVAQRTKEIGVRMALGARSTNVSRMVLRHVGVMTVLGATAGIGAAYALGRYAESLLFGLEGVDPGIVLAVAATLGSVAFVSGYLPARSASRVDPMVALREE